MTRTWLTIAGGVIVGVVGTALVLKLHVLPLAHMRTFCEKSRHHCIRVTVDPATNVVNVDAEPLIKKGKNHTIHWIIDNGDSQNFKFASNGIAFLGTNGDGGNKEFSCAPDTGNDPDGTQLIFACDDYDGAPAASSFPQGYKYNVNLVDPVGNPLSLDPHIVNN